MLPSITMSPIPPLCSTLAPLRNFRQELDLYPVAQQTRAALQRIVRSQHWRTCRELLRQVVATPLATNTIELCADTVRISSSIKLSQEALDALVKALSPWRIGPFDVHGCTIDSEWRSFIKWRRIEPLLELAPDLRIADVGCSNGYFLFKLLHHSPSIAVGFDPIERCWLQFALLNALARHPSLAFIPAGISSLRAFPSFFDRILCMGVIYHQRDPFQVVRSLYNATRPGGTVLLESLVVDRDGPYLLVPDKRYAKMRNAWVIPTADALAALMQRAGFKEISIHRFGPITTEEQRRTAHAPFESLAEFLDPEDPSRTVEGYPAPHSAAVVAVRA